MENKKIFSGLKFLLVGSLLIVMLSVFVYALGIGSDGSKLQLYPGETRDTNFLLQNYGAESSNIVVEATIEEGSEYISFPDGNSFSVNANGNFVVPIRYSIPQNAKIGDIYSVKVLFRVVSGDTSNEAGGGTTIEFAINPRVVIEIEVVPKIVKEEVPVVEEKTKAGSTVWMWIIVAIVLIIIVWVIVAVSKKKASEGMQKGK